MKKDWSIFINSIFFVLGFSIIFSLVGVLLQSVLATISLQVQTWLGRIGGTIIIIFGLYLVGLIKLSFLDQEHKFKVKKTRYQYATSFLFGSAFAVGWTPCVGAILGAILTLAITNPASAFTLMLSYSLGLGIPFLLVGFFTNQAKTFIQKAGKWISYVKYIFGALLIILGVLVFTNQLAKVANFQFAANLLLSIDSQLSFGTSINIGISFLAGIASFLSPCILPLIPAFLSYLAATSIKNEKE